MLFNYLYNGLQHIVHFPCRRYDSHFGLKCLFWGGLGLAVLSILCTGRTEIKCMLEFRCGAVRTVTWPKLCYVIFILSLDGFWKPICIYWLARNIMPAGSANFEILREKKTWSYNNRNGPEHSRMDRNAPKGPPLPEWTSKLICFMHINL